MSDQLKELSAALPRRTMLVIGLFQGLALLVLYRAEVRDQWLSTIPPLKYPLWAIALLLPLMLLLSVNTSNIKRAAMGCCAYVGIVALLMVYIGLQAVPVDEFPVYAVVSAAVTTLFIASFKAQMYIQQWASDLPREYRTLFTLSWRNFFVPTLAVIFTLLCLGILMLWAALFDTIGIDFFSYLFRQDWFLFPVLGTAFSVGVVVFRELEQVLDTLTRLAQDAISLLLPIVAVISIGYVATLMVVGTNLLWETGWGTSQMLWLIALTLFFVNAVYQDGRLPPKYTQTIHYVVAAGIGVLMIPVCLSAYGLYLRIDQYGLTISRGNAVVVWLILSLFVVGYVVMIARRRGTWSAGLGRINQGMSVVIIVILLLLNSPLADLRKLTVSSQLGRLDDGRVAPEDFDVRYVRTHLARPGFEAMQTLEEKTANETLLAKLKRDYGQPRQPPEPPDRESFLSQIERVGDAQIPPALEEKLASQTIVVSDRSILTPADLNGDGEPEFIFLNFQQGRLLQARYFIERDGEWQAGRLTYDYTLGMDRDNLLTLIEDGSATVVEPELQDVIIGRLRFKPGP